MVDQKLIVKCIDLFMPTLILQLPFLMLRLFKLDFFKILKSFSTSGNYLRLMLKILFKDNVETSNIYADNLGIFAL